MDKKPFDRSQEQGAGVGQPTRSEPGRKVATPPEKHKPEQPARTPRDKTMPGAERRDSLESDRSDRESGRPVQLEEDRRRHTRPDDDKGSEGHPDNR
jgi:hypothetical protein